jgi:hypothetical protein
MKLTSKKVSEIAEELLSGMKVFINPKDLEIVPILDWDGMYGDSEVWEDELERIDREWPKLVVLQKMPSQRAFTIMEEFIDEVGDKKLQTDLINILTRRSPFANFKAVVESSTYRQKWFDFRDMKYVDYTKELLTENKIEFE